MSEAVERRPGKRPDARPDEDGHCTVCGLPFDDDDHECPPGFLRAIDSTVENIRRAFEGGGSIGLGDRIANLEAERDALLVLVEEAAKAIRDVTEKATPDRYMASMMDVPREAIGRLAVLLSRLNEDKPT